MGDAPGAKHFTAPEPDCIDWLLLAAKSTAGNGLFSRVTYIQRLHTDGGKPPAGGCSQADNQTEVMVEYSAQYLFYGPATETAVVSRLSPFRESLLPARQEGACPRTDAHSRTVAWIRQIESPTHELEQGDSSFLALWALQTAVQPIVGRLSPQITDP